MGWKCSRCSKLGWLLAALTLVACGSETGGTADAGPSGQDAGTGDAGDTGPLGGDLAFPVRFAGTLERRLADGGANPNEVVVVLADDPNLQGTLCQGRPYPGAEVRSVEISLTRSPGGSFVATHPVGGTMDTVYREFTGYPNGSVVERLRLKAEDGAVTVTGSRDGGIEGGIELAFPAPDGGSRAATLRGTFAAPYCGTL